jgi:hypothetical protein
LGFMRNYRPKLAFRTPSQEATLFSVGLDLHDKRIAIGVLGETGPVVRRAQVRSIDEMMRLLEALPHRFEVCYEASCGYGHYHDLLSPIAARVTVAHPSQVASRGPTWRIATPRYGMGATAYPLMALRPGG